MKSDKQILQLVEQKIYSAISQRLKRFIKQNLTFAIGVKLAILLLSVFGIADMWEAVFADVGTTLITILNTIRILK